MGWSILDADFTPNLVRIARRFTIIGASKAIATLVHPADVRFIVGPQFEVVRGYHQITAGRYGESEYRGLFSETDFSRCRRSRRVPSIVTYGNYARLTHRLPCRRVQIQSIDAGDMRTFFSQILRSTDVRD